MHKQLVILRVVIMSVVILGLLLGACQVSSTPVPTPAGPAAAPTSPPPKAVQVTPTSLPKPAGPAAAPTSPPPKPVGELVLALEDLGGELLDPVEGGSSSKLHLPLMYDYLVGVDRIGTKLDPSTGVAKRWEQSADGRAWTFWLRDGIKFHNGEELTAEDVKFSVERNTSKTATGPNASFLNTLVAGVDVEDKYRITIRLKKPDWTFPYYLSPYFSATEGMIVPKNYLTQKGDDYFRDHPIGSGPYMFEKLMSGNYITYKASGQPHWYVGVPKYERITFKLVPEESTRRALLETGGADIITVDAPTAATLKRQGKFNVFTKEGQAVSGIWMFQMYTENNPLGKEKVRQALALGLNVPEMLDNIIYGMGRLASGFPMPSWGLEYTPMEPTLYDPEKAKRLLQEAGYGPGDIQLNIYLYTRPGFAEQQKLSTLAAAAYWEKIGIKSKIINMDWGALLPLIRAQKLESPALAVGHPYGARYITELQSWWGGSSPQGAIKDPQLDALIAAALAAPDAESYKVAGSAAARYMRDHFVTIPLYEIGSYVATKKEISNWEQVGAMGRDYNVRYLFWR